MPDKLLNEIADIAEEQIKQGNIIFQKFTCSNCNSRQTMEEPNKIYVEGVCEECNHVTKINECGLAVIICIKVKEVKNKDE